MPLALWVTPKGTWHGPMLRVLNIANIFVQYSHSILHKSRDHFTNESGKSIWRDRAGNGDQVYFLHRYQWYWIGIHLHATHYTLHGRHLPLLAKPQKKRHKLNIQTWIWVNSPLKHQEYEAIDSCGPISGLCLRQKPYWPTTGLLRPNRKTIISMTPC